MRIVVCSDVHGNLLALEAVLADIRQIGWPDALAVAGDLVLGGPRPAEALALLRSIPGAQFVKGNCDGYVVDPQDVAEDTRFVRDRMRADDLAFLDGLPHSIRIEATPGHAILICHANPQNLEDPLGPDAAEADIQRLLHGVDAEIVAFGHVHLPYVRQLPPWTLVDVASVGLPRDGDRRAVYALLTWDDHRWVVEYHRVVYDWDAVARDFATVGFPDAHTAATTLLNARYTW